LISLFGYVEYTSLPPYNYIGVFLLPLPHYNPPYPLPYSGGTYPPSLPPSFFLLYRGIIPSAKVMQKNSGKNFWGKILPFTGVIYIYIYKNSDMKKVIKLTEKDLGLIIKRVLKEESEDISNSTVCFSVKDTEILFGLATAYCNSHSGDYLGSRFCSTLYDIGKQMKDVGLSGGKFEIMKYY